LKNANTLQFYKHKLINYKQEAQLSLG